MSKAPALHLNRSNALFQQAQQLLVGGVNSPVRTFRAVGNAHPLFIQKAKGAYVYDVDGNRYLDYMGAWGPMILGHAHETIEKAVIEAVKNGLAFGLCCETEMELAKAVQACCPHVEQVRFVNSGGEAAQTALRLARGYTKREKVVKFNGCYHGSIDPLLVKAGSGLSTLGIPDSAGVTAGSAQDTLCAEFNDLESVIALFEANAGEVAALILEIIPGNMGVVTPKLPFLQGLRDLCDREGAVLIADEVMTGFRVGLGGAHALFGLVPDLIMFGKVMGGGMPVGAVGGRTDIMQTLSPQGPVYQGGTLSGNPVAMAAGLAALTLLQQQERDDGFYAELNRKSAMLLDGLKSICKSADIGVQTCHFGGMLGFYFSDTPVENYRQAMAANGPQYQRLFRGLLKRGIVFAPSALEAAFVSTAHGEEEIEQTLDAMKEVL